MLMVVSGGEDGIGGKRNKNLLEVITTGTKCNVL